MKTLSTFIVIAFIISVSPDETQSQDFEPDPSLYKQESQYTGFDSTFYFLSQGDSLFCRKWGELNKYGTRKILLVIHGIGYHSLPFRKIMNYTGNCNVSVYAMDLRGHGFSGGTKGVLESNEKVFADMDNMISLIKNENPNTQIYLLGTSMGGLYILGYSLSRLNSADLSGLILVGPALTVHKSQIIKISNFKFLWYIMFSQLKQGIHIDDKILKMSTNNQVWIDSRKNDSLALHHVCADYLMEIRKMQKTVKRKPELSLLSLPILIQHGQNDKIADIRGSYYLKKNLSTAKTELKVYPKSYHSLFWDNDSNLIFNDLISWFMVN